MAKYRKKGKLQKELYGIDKREPDPKLELFDMLKCYIPKDMHEMLKMIAEERGLPLGRVVSYAIYNEIQARGASFDIGIRLPQTVTEDVIQNSQVVLQFIDDARAVSIDMLVLCQGQLRLTKEEILASVRFLLNSNTIEHYDRGKYAGLIQLRRVTAQRSKVLSDLNSETDAPPPQPKYTLR